MDDFEEIEQDFFIDKLTNSIERPLGAIHLDGRKMLIETIAALKLIDLYFKNSRP